MRSVEKMIVFAATISESDSSHEGRETRFSLDLPNESPSQSTRPAISARIRRSQSAMRRILFIWQIRLLPVFRFSALFNPEPWFWANIEIELAEQCSTTKIIVAKKRWRLIESFSSPVRKSTELSLPSGSDWASCRDVSFEIFGGKFFAAALLSKHSTDWRCVDVKRNRCWFNRLDFAANFSRN